MEYEDNTDSENIGGESGFSVTDQLNKAWDWFKTPEGATVGAGLLGGGLSMLFDDKPDPSGYQGKIPSYTYNRQQLQMPQDPNRRPGSGGRRYFTDGTYSGGSEGEGMPSPAINRTQPAGIANVAAGQSNPNNPTIQPEQQQFAKGGIASLQEEGRYLRGKTDGMADEVDATIDGKEPAKLSDGEFVIPADVVSHLGNGNSEAGAKLLQEMMARVRKERTGNEKQGKQIDPEKHLLG